jgi:hypothetical protein
MPGESVSGASQALFVASQATGSKGIRSQALMHFSAYLMIAAMVLMGLQLAYAFYQLAAFFL